MYIPHLLSSNAATANLFDNNAQYWRDIIQKHRVLSETSTLLFFLFLFLFFVFSFHLFDDSHSVVRRVSEMTGAEWAPSVLERIEKEGGNQDVLEVCALVWCCGG
jgi:hypothetical protein